MGSAPYGISSDGTHVWVANNNTNTVTELSIQQVPSCAAGFHPHVLNARYAKGTFTGLFCVNAKGFGTYTQGLLSGFGWVTVVKGTTAIAALGKNLFLRGPRRAPRVHSSSWLRHRSSSGRSH